MADAIPAIDSRASVITCVASPSLEAAWERDASKAVRESASAWSIASAATSLTVETNVELMVSSRVLAPVSVIFGATGPVFSFTKYSISGFENSPVVRESKCSVKSSGMTNTA